MFCIARGNVDHSTQAVSVPEAMASFTLFVNRSENESFICFSDRDLLAPVTARISLISGSHNGATFEILLESMCNASDVSWVRSLLAMLDVRILDLTTTTKPTNVNTWTL